MDKFSKLKAVALAATLGPWELVYDDWSDGDDALISSESRDGMVAIAKIEGGGSESGYDEPFSSEQQANAAFIAAANPAVILALLAALEAPAYPEKLPPHVYRDLVNALRDTAVKYSGTDQLRERLNTTLSKFIEPDHPHSRTTMLSPATRGNSD
jgi:hypothetical protein